jgi:2-amino-4-hydroxy-6-hydroxymethyldihydropteridine diphosphokinase
MRYYLSLGSNLGDKKGNLTRAVSALENKKVFVRSRSELYKTEPVDVPGQPWFLNCVLEVETRLRPLELLGLVKSIEKKMGRNPAVKKGPRCLDIDILMAGDETVTTETLTIPHPRMHLRNFVLVPLREIAPNAVHPKLKKTVCELLQESGDKAIVNKVKWETSNVKRKT